MLITKKSSVIGVDALKVVPAEILSHKGKTLFEMAELK